MTIPAGSEDPTELYPSVGAGAAVYSDSDPLSGASYSAFLAGAQQIYPANPVVLLESAAERLGVGPHARGRRPLGRALVCRRHRERATMAGFSRDGGPAVSRRGDLGTVACPCRGSLLWDRRDVI